MIIYDKLAIELVSMWVDRSVGSQESFGYVISVFLRENPLIETTNDVKAILSASKKMADKVIKQYPHDGALHLSHRAFSSALDHFIACVN
jgi:hypothetical protein